MLPNTMRYLVLPLVIAISSFGSSASQWISYSAQYTETSSINIPGGKQENSKKIGQEIRSSDGSTAKFENINGQTASAELWLSCGEAAALNYGTKQARITKRAPPQHMQIPPDAPLGVQVIAGLKATGYPIHLKDGTGSIWIAMDDEIPVKTEVHTSVNGVQYDYVKELSAINLDPSAEHPAMTVPSGFSITNPSGASSGTCIAGASSH